MDVTGAVGFRNQAGGSVVHDDSTLVFDKTPQQAVLEIQGFRARLSAVAPKLPGERLIPRAVVVDEFSNVVLFTAMAEEKMIQCGVVQNNKPGALQRAMVDAGVQWVIADMVDLAVTRARRVNLDHGPFFP